MIEKIDLLLADRSQNDARKKINELVEASNRQDRVLAQLIHNGKGGLSQYLDPQDYEETMKAYKEDEDGA